MKITINQHDEEVSINTKHDDLTANQMADIMFRISLANGYYQQNVADAFYELGKAHLKMEEYSENIWVRTQTLIQTSPLTTSAEC